MLDKLALILTIIGGINWGLIGIFQFDLVAWICGGQGSIISRIIYTIVALAAIWCISLLFREHDTVAEGTTPDKIKLRQMVCRSFLFCQMLIGASQIKGSIGIFLKIQKAGSKNTNTRLKPGWYHGFGSLSQPVNILIP